MSEFYKTEKKLDLIRPQIEHLGLELQVKEPVKAELINVALRLLANLNHPNIKQIVEQINAILDKN